MPKCRQNHKKFINIWDIAQICQYPYYVNSCNLHYKKYRKIRQKAMMKVRIYNCFPGVCPPETSDISLYKRCELSYFYKGKILPSIYISTFSMPKCK